ncbi:MAG: 16S rRNA (cytosine(1402)-N(4))-methyltransferase, partial [Deltaproteobacteria bacterium]|nr:16S rRNA (cytosine(1402)-N(4))-methyltransferase [Deltaproteobacteria bacterium]
MRSGASGRRSMGSDLHTTRPGHLPVMPAAVLRECAVQTGMVVLDCTAGGGGHLGRFADAVGPTGRVIALDRDERAFANDAAGG